MVTINNLDFFYKKKHSVLKDINLQLNGGRIASLLGKNGVGKSTLLHLIAGLQFQINGEINVMNYKPTQRNVSFLQNIFILDEELPSLPLSIAKFASINSVFYPNFSKENFHNYLNEFEITDTKQRIDKLSFGTRKKVFISFALACNTTLLLMDEPTNGLDIPSKSSLRKLLRLSMTDDKLIIISTHQARDLQNILDSVIILDNERLILNATDEEITKKLCFKIADGSENTDDILYSESSVAGNQIVKVNNDNEDSNLDIELLFNAVFSDKEKFLKLFNK